MIKQGFYIGDRDWWVMVYYGVGENDLGEVYGTLIAAGCEDWRAQRACMNLSRKNTGYTFTNFIDHATFVFVSRTTSAEQMFDSIEHELKHIVEHISEYYGLDPKEELPAYLQGEVGRLMFPAVVMAVCPTSASPRGSGRGDSSFQS